MESRSEYIIGDECLGMEPQLDDQNYHNYGKYLVPPVLSAQIELMATSTLLHPFRKEVLCVLQDFMINKKKPCWFSIFLSLFILLHSCAMLTEFERRLAVKWGHEVSLLSVLIALRLILVCFKLLLMLR